MTKAEKLARELIALSERYSARDFAAAVELIRSGRMFEHAIGSVKTVRDIRRSLSGGSALPRISKGSRQIKQEKTRHDLTVDVQLDIDDLMSGYDSKYKEDLSSFSKSFLQREILVTGQSAREFAEKLGIKFPKKLPIRQVILKNLLRALADINSDTRATFLREAYHNKEGGSSLQRWSDLIVRRDEN